MSENNEVEEVEVVSTFVDPYADVDLGDLSFESPRLSDDSYKEILAYLQKRFRSRTFVKSFNAMIEDLDTDDEKAVDIDKTMELVDFQLGELRDKVYTELEDDFVSVSQVVESISQRINSLPNR